MAGGRFRAMTRAARSSSRLREGVADGGGDLIQFVPDSPVDGYESALRPVFDAAEAAGLSVTFTLIVGNARGRRHTPA